MIRVRIRTLWEGKVGVRDRYIEEALEKDEDLEILHGDERMIIDNDKIEERIVERSAEVFFDKYSGNSHRLIYFLWKPIEPKLF